MTAEQPPSGGGHREDAKENNTDFHATILTAFPSSGGIGKCRWNGLDFMVLVNWNTVDGTGQFGQS